VKRDRLTYWWPSIGKLEVIFDKPTFARVRYRPSFLAAAKTLRELQKQPTEGASREKPNYPRE